MPKPWRGTNPSSRSIIMIHSVTGHTWNSSGSNGRRCRAGRRNSGWVHGGIHQIAETPFAGRRGALAAPWRQDRSKRTSEGKPPDVDDASIYPPPSAHERGANRV